MRGSYQVVSLMDPRWNKIGKDFICPHRGALNFDMKKYVEKTSERLQCLPPADLRYFIYWGESIGNAESTNWPFDR